MEYQTLQTSKAKRCTVQFGKISLTVFQMPDGTYRLSQSEVSGVINKPARSIFAFLHSKQLKALLGKDFDFSLPCEKAAVEGSQKPITPIPVEVALLYWHKWAQQSNTLALALVLALAKRSIYEAADEVFLVKRTQDERDHTLAADLSSEGIARIEALHRNISVEHQFSFQPETQTERELMLRIRLAELQLEQEKLLYSCNPDGIAAKQLKQIGVVSWEVVKWAQQTLDLPSDSAAFDQICKLGYGFENDQWLRVKLQDHFLVLPWQPFNSLVKTVKQLRIEQN